jgi:hypothetical protein
MSLDVPNAEIAQTTRQVDNFGSYEMLFRCAQEEVISVITVKPR